MTVTREYESELDAMWQALETQVAGLQVRAPQRVMSQRIMTALVAGNSIALESATGTGKTLAYLLPTMLSQARIIIAVGDKVLQDRLLGGDYQRLQGCGQARRRVVSLKGFESYLCRLRLEGWLAYGGHGLANSALQAFMEWLQQTATGSIEELPPVLAAHQQALTTAADQCAGEHCPHFSQCFVQRARQQALQAPVLVINHSLLLADEQFTAKGMTAVLPTADHVIVDEAHRLPDMLIRHNAEMLSGYQVRQWLRRCRRQLTLSRRDPLTQTLLAFEQLWSRYHSQLRERVARDSLLQVTGKSFAPLLTLMQQLSDQLRQHHMTVEDSAELHEVLRAWLQQLQRQVQNNEVVYAEVHTTELTLLSERVVQPFASLRHEAVAWVFCSATLTVDRGFDFFSQLVHLPHLECEIMPGTLDYGERARIWIPQHLPSVKDDTFAAAWATQLVQLTTWVPGGILALFSSYEALQACAEQLEHLALPLQRELLIQSPHSARQQLLSEFEDRGDALMLATGSFWEGVDVRGRALACVAIDKLPFAAPDDWIAVAWRALAQNRKRDWFQAYMVPQAIMRLRQGVGRLLRHPDDYGLVVLGDTRVDTRPYGPRFLHSLAPLPRIRTEAEAIQFLSGYNPAALTGERLPSGVDATDSFLEQTDHEPLYSSD